MVTAASEVFPTKLVMAHRFGGSPEDVGAARDDPYHLIGQIE